MPQVSKPISDVSSGDTGSVTVQITPFSGSSTYAEAVASEPANVNNYTNRHIEVEYAFGTGTAEVIMQLEPLEEPVAGLCTIVAWQNSPVDGDVQILNGDDNTVVGTMGLLPVSDDYGDAWTIQTEDFTPGSLEPVHDWTDLRMRFYQADDGGAFLGSGGLTYAYLEAPHPENTFQIAASADDANAEYGQDPTFFPPVINPDTNDDRPDQNVHSIWTGTQFNCCQAFFRWDTSSLPNDAVIESAVLKIFGWSGYPLVEVSDDPDFVGQWYSYDGSINISDFTYPIDRSAMDVKLDTLVDDAWNEIPLLGVDTEINLTGYTGMVVGIQRPDDGAPFGVNDMVWRSYDYDHNFAPILVVTLEGDEPLTYHGRGTP